jgi:RHS repeat-associated protein
MTNDCEYVQKSSGKLYWYGDGSDPLDESDGSGTISAEYIFFGGKRIARRDSSGNVVYYFADHLGTSRIITDSSGTVLDDNDFYPFGAERPILSSSGNVYKFMGKERDSESGNDDFGARYYSSGLGRFISSDWSAVPVPVPYANLTNPQTLNLYAIVHDNPETFADLDGHQNPDSGAMLQAGQDGQHQNPSAARDEAALCGSVSGCFQTSDSHGNTVVNVYSSTETTTTNADGSTTFTDTTTTNTYTFNQAGNMTGQQQTETTSYTTSQSGDIQTSHSTTTKSLTYGDAAQQFGANNLGAFQHSFDDTRGTLGRLPGTVAADAHAHPWAYTFHVVEIGAAFTPAGALGVATEAKQASELIVSVAVLLQELTPDPHH